MRRAFYACKFRLAAQSDPRRVGHALVLRACSLTRTKAQPRSENCSSTYGCFADLGIDRENLRLANGIHQHLAQPARWRSARHHWAEWRGQVDVSADSRRRD